MLMRGTTRASPCVAWAGVRRSCRLLKKHGSWSFEILLFDFGKYAVMDTHKAWALKLRRQQHDSYTEAFERLMRDLKAGE